MNNHLGMEGKKESEEIARKQFGRVLRKIRKARGQSIYGFARDAKVDAGYISRIENGHRNPPQMKVIERLANILGVSVAFLSLAAGYLPVDELGNRVTEDLLGKRLAKEISCTNLDQVSEGQLPSASDVSVETLEVLHDMSRSLENIQNLLIVILANQEKALKLGR